MNSAYDCDENVDLLPYTQKDRQIVDHSIIEHTIVSVIQEETMECSLGL